MKKLNEENACIALIEIMNRITGVEYHKECSPDEQNTSSPDVDYILISKCTRPCRLAVEHTIVESFENQVSYSNQSYDVVELINEKCKGKLPTDRYYYLIIPPSLIVGLKRRQRRQFVKAMSCWVPSVAHALTERQHVSRVYSGSEVRLWCPGSYPGENGNVWRARTPPTDGDTLKRERFRKAIQEKIPKLYRYKLKGHATALLLEDISGALRDPNRCRKDLTIKQRFMIHVFIDYLVILASNENRMIVGEVWKEKRRWYRTIPGDRILSLKAGSRN